MVIVHWDGAKLPDELKDLPPGRYALSPVDSAPPLTDEEEAGLIDALRAAREGGLLTQAEVRTRIEKAWRR
jgi:hypothetical protein